jgi:hypothetical protein
MNNKERIDILTMGVVGAKKEEEDQRWRSANIGCRRKKTSSG